MALVSPNRRHNLTYKEIIDQFVSASNAHLGINQFDTGTLDFLDANAVNKKYPYLYLRPLASTGVTDRQKSLTFELYSMDVPHIKDESPVEVLSATENYIYDIVSWFNEGPSNRQQVYDVTLSSIAPVNEAFQDRVYGWVATIDVATPFRWDYCNFPQLTSASAPVAPVPVPIAPPVPIPVVTSSFAIRISDYDGAISTASCYNGTNDESGSVIAYAIVTASLSFPDNISGSALYFDSGATMPFSMSSTASVPDGNRFSIISGSQTGSRTHSVLINTGSGWNEESGSQFTIVTSSVEICGEVGVIYTSFSASANPLDGCELTSSFDNRLYYLKQSGSYPCDIEGSFLYTDDGATLLYSGALVSGSIPTGSDWLGIADSSSSLSSSYQLHMDHRDSEPTGSIYIYEIWSCEDNQRTCLQ